MILWKNFSQIITLEGALKKEGRSLNSGDLSIIENASIIFDHKKILWVGKSDNTPSYNFSNIRDFSGTILTPELVDSHTHLIFGGNRSSEYVKRLNGEDYQKIANEGGGILYTVDQTNSLPDSDLYELAKKRIAKIASYGVGVIEIKSGYSLNLDGEVRLSKIINRLKIEFSPKLRIFNTFMAAHAVPKKFKDSASYVSQVVIPSLEILARDRIIDFLDIFHEEGYFSDSDFILLAKACNKFKIPIRAHIDEFNDGNGIQIALNYNAVSCDHLLRSNLSNIKLLASSNTVATLLPGTAFFLGKQLPPARVFLDSGCRVALASDFNPGSSHCDNILNIASISGPSLKMNIGELFTAITLNAAYSLGLQKSGAIIEGFEPRFSIFNTNQIDDLFYRWGENLYIPTDRFF